MATRFCILPQIEHIARNRFRIENGDRRAKKELKGAGRIFEIAMRFGDKTDL